MDERAEPEGFRAEQEYACASSSSLQITSKSFTPILVTPIPNSP